MAPIGGVDCEISDGIENWTEGELSMFGNMILDNDYIDRLCEQQRLQ